MSRRRAGSVSSRKSARSISPTGTSSTPSSPTATTSTVQHLQSTATSAASTLVSKTTATARPLGHRLSSTLLGEENSYHRYIATFIAAFVLGTAVRTACFAPSLPIFGKYLETNFAPVERNDVSWGWIAVLRAIDVFVGVGVWEGAGRAVDGPYLGVLLAGISRPPLFFLLHEHYLLSSRTLSILLLTDAATLATILFTISLLLPYPSPFLSLPSHHLRPLHTLARILHPRTINPHLVSLLLALVSATTLSALASYLVSHTYLPDLLRTHTLRSTFPSSSTYVHTQLHGSSALANPFVLVPTLRYSTVLGTTRDAPSMPLQLLVSALTPVLYSILATIILPRAEPLRIGAISAFLSGAVALISMWNVMPVTLQGAAGVAAEIAVREGATAALVAWVLEDARRPLRKIEVERRTGEDGSEVTVVRAAVTADE